MSEEITKGMNMGDNFWNLVIDGYFNEKSIIEYNDKTYGTGASEYIGRAYQYYFSK